MDLDNIGGYSLLGLAKKNVILGKNGCGKSHLLKQLEQVIRHREGFGNVRYISPERGGLLQYEPNIEQAIAQNPQWIGDQRRQNQSGNFRQQSATLFRRLELLVLREIEQKHREPGYVPISFSATIDSLNTLLDRVTLERDNARGFKIIDRETKSEASPQAISSGESELISLGIEFHAFVKECVADKDNVLLVDEPDVHLHPDLQDRLARFIISVLKDQPVTLVLATHSTALLSALADDPHTRVAFMRRGRTSLSFKPVTNVDRNILPIFGAHPLSNIFNQAPVLLIEGEDDERVWQQAVRSSQGKFRVFPCNVDGLPHFAEFEAEVSNIIDAVYDNARAYSLRDRDQQPELINDVGHVIRMRLGCRAAENIMLTNEVLGSVGLDWPAMAEKIEQWIVTNHRHQYHQDMSYFEAAGLDRKNFDLKNIRNILVGLMSNKPWEVLTGQAIAAFAITGGQAGEGSIREYLGEKTSQQLLNLSA